MNVVTSEILADLCGLSPGLIGLAAIVGVTLWLLGWWSHRFWVVLLATVAAGIFGLFEAPAQRAQPLIASLLLALAAGLLALALVRLLAFLAGGSAGLVLVPLLFPNLDQPLIVFLCAGLIGLLLFRWCVIGLTSFVGSVLLIYAGLAFLNLRGSIDAVAWLDKGYVLVNWILGLMTALGFFAQFTLERRNRGEEEEVREKPEKKKKKNEDGFLAWSRKKAG